MCVCASGAIKTKKRSWVWHKEEESDGFILAKGWVGTIMGTAEASMPACWCAFVSVCLVSQSAAPQSASEPQDGSNLEIRSTTNKAELQRAEAGEKRRKKRIEARARDIHLNLEGGEQM